MRIITHAEQPTEPWRPEVRTRMLVSAEVGARQLCQFEQWSAPGAGAPTHHHAVEEILTILDGQAEIWLDGTTCTLVGGQSLIVPAGRPHGFRNTGTADLHTLATLAAPIFEAAYEDARETPRRWTPR